MTLRQLPKRQWQQFFDALAPLLREGTVEVETAGLGLDAKLAQDWVRLAELAYDAERGALQLAAQGTERQIRHPAQVLVRIEDECLHSLELVDRAGEHDFVIFREPLPLPEPA
ncbi:MAG TPA: DUF5335 family protein [Burkholderiales bacterium]|nr:DUF5335 family protein [Burkholderiales bacterium]